tara:strand:- start:566 stop:1147 length:582 start_codon:yes stop_codon:yes gene_type:complete
MNKNINFLKSNQRSISSKKRLVLHQSINLNNFFFYKILDQYDWFKKSKIISSFLSIKTEIPTNNLNFFIEKSGKVLSLPIIDGNKNDILIFKTYSAGDILIKGKFGINEPQNTNVVLPDIIFVPCLAYDDLGYRLGYGGGYYDKTISYLKSIDHYFLTIGLAYDQQKVNNVITDNLDQKLNYILTEKQLYKIL